MEVMLGVQQRLREIWGTCFKNFVQQVTVREAMMNNIRHYQNRLVIELARENLNSGGFANVQRNRNQGTFPHVYATARHVSSGIEYLIGITGRVERKEDGDWDPRFNLVRSEDDRREARALAERMKRKLAFVAIALRKADASYAPYFGESTRLGSRGPSPCLLLTA